MDNTVEAAITAAPITDAERDKWFTALCTATQNTLDNDPSATWNTLSSALDSTLTTAGFTSTTIEPLTRHLDADSGRAIDILRALAALGPTELAAAHQRLTTPTTGTNGSTGGSTTPPPANTPTYDPAAWNAFLATNGTRWNGAEADWSTFRTWFAYTAGQQGLAQPATAFLDHVETTADKIAAFAAYGVTIARPAGAAPATTLPDVSSYPDLTTGATGAWVDYLDTMLQRNGF
jgi:hypothetical protein